MQSTQSVLRSEAEVKYKYEAAITFCKSKISEMRAEERRNPCQSFARIGTEEFVAQFLPVVKVERLSIPNYHLYVAILRRYCRTVDASKKNTYKGFERWLEANFANGSPFAEDLQLVYNEEERLLNPPHQSEQGILIASGESYLEPCLEPASPYQYEADEQ
ncbi:hypothetical protein EMCRGX_G022897 [Ephydatia muelleri]